MIVLGVGAGLTIPSATESAMGSPPGGHTGVGSATNGASLLLAGFAARAVRHDLTDRSKVTAGSHPACAAAVSGRVCGQAYGRPDGVAAGQDYRQRPYRLSHAEDPLGQASLSGPGDHFGGEPRQEADKHRGGTGTHRRPQPPRHPRARIGRGGPTDCSAVMLGG